MRWDHTTRAQDRFHDEGGNGSGALKGDFILQRLQAQLGQSGGIAFVERVAIGVWRRNMMASGQQGFVLRPEVCIAVYRGPAHMGAVVALLETEELGASGLAANLVVLTRETKRRFDGIRSARGEERPCQPVRGKKAAQLFCKLDYLIVAGAPKG